jgi:hypothetical protein
LVVTEYISPVHIFSVVLHINVPPEGITIGAGGAGGIIKGGITGPGGCGGVGGGGGIIGLDVPVVPVAGKLLKIGNIGNGHVNGSDVGVGIPLITVTLV